MSERGGNRILGNGFTFQPSKVDRDHIECDRCGKAPEGAAEKWLEIPVESGPDEYDDYHIQSTYRHVECPEETT